MSDRKPRSDSKLDNLADHVFMELRDKLMGNSVTYEALEEWLLVEHGVESSRSALSRFYQKHCKPIVVGQRQIAALKAEAVIDGANAAGADLDAASLELLKQKTFELLDSDKWNPKDIKGLFQVLLKSQAQELDRDKFEALVEKERNAQEAKEKLAQLKDGEHGLTPETLEQIEQAVGLL